jgi:drug/metabolite transporter (DMT)-like permease
MSWQLLTALSVCCLSVSVLLQRVLLAKDKTNAVAYVIVFQGLVGILTAAAAVVHGFRAPDLHGLWFPAVACISLYAVGHIVYAKTLQRVEASVFAVLFATHAVWISALGVVIFHEHMGIAQILGAALIFVSVCLLIKRPKDFKLDTGTLLGLLTGFLFGLAITCWGYVGRHVADPLSWSAISFLAPALLVWVIHPSATTHMQQLFEGRVLKRMLTLALFYAGGCAAMLFAYKYGEFSVVSPLRQAGVVLTVLLALLFLRQERTHIPRKLIAAGICLVGIFCLL